MCLHTFRPGMALVPTKHISADFIGDAVLDSLEFAYYDELPESLARHFRGQTISMGPGVFRPVLKCTKCGHSLYTPKEA